MAENVPEMLEDDADENQNYGRTAMALPEGRRALRNLTNANKAVPPKFVKIGSIFHRVSSPAVRRLPFSAHHLNRNLGQFGTLPLSGFDEARRKVLVEFLVYACLRFNYSNDVLHGAVFRLDQCLTQADIPKNLMMAAIVLKLVASSAKSRMPTYDTLRELAGGNYEEYQLHQLEDKIRAIVGPYIPVTTAVSFLISSMYELEPKEYHMSCYVCEIAMFVNIPQQMPNLPSVVAAACIAYARYVLGMLIWPLRLQTVTQMCLDELKDTILWLSKSCVSFKDYAEPDFLVNKYDTADHEYVGKIGGQLIDEESFRLIFESYKRRNI